MDSQPSWMKNFQMGNEFLRNSKDSLNASKTMEKHDLRSSKLISKRIAKSRFIFDEGYIPSSVQKLHSLRAEIFKERICFSSMRNAFFMASSSDSLRT
jgi:hypothetical protein